MPPKISPTPRTADPAPSESAGPEAADVAETVPGPAATARLSQDPPTPADQPATTTPPTPDPARPADPATTTPPPARPADPATTTPPTPATPAGRRLVGAAVLGLAAALLCGFGVGATLAAHHLRQQATARNVALTNPAATSEVSRQITAAVNTVFSYSYADTARTRQAAQHLLTGQAIQQYNKLFSLVQQQAPGQKLVVTTRVTDAGVEFLAGDHARVLVFANQQDTRTGTHQTSYGGAMFAVTALREGGTWKIENIDTFGG
jgi:Mce-associated membrane protein